MCKICDAVNDKIREEAFQRRLREKADAAPDGITPVSVNSTEGMDADKLYRAWREGYGLGYSHGEDDAMRYERGGGRNTNANEDREEEWNGSETKASIAGDEPPLARAN